MLFFFIFFHLEAYTTDRTNFFIFCLPKSNYLPLQSKDSMLQGLSSLSQKCSSFYGRRNWNYGCSLSVHRKQLWFLPSSTHKLTSESSVSNNIIYVTIYTDNAVSRQQHGVCCSLVKDKMCIRLSCRQIFSWVTLTTRLPAHVTLHSLLWNVFASISATSFCFPISSWFSEIVKSSTVVAVFRVNIW